MAASYKNFLRAIRSGDIVTVQSYLAQDAVRTQVTQAEYLYTRYPFLEWSTSSHRGRPSCGAECLLETDRLHIEVLAWFFSPEQIATIDRMLAFLLTPLVVLAWKSEDIEPLELLLSSQVFAEMAGLLELQEKKILNGLLQRPWGMDNMEIITRLLAHDAQCNPAIAREFSSGPLGRTHPMDDHSLLISYGIASTGGRGHEFAASNAVMNDWSRDIYG